MQKPKNANDLKTNQKLLILGLGNPKIDLSMTYHNIGILFVDFLGNNISWKTKNKFSYCQLKDLILAKSNEYMNNSGLAALEALTFFKIKPENLILVHDDSDLYLGTYKIQLGKNAAGHNGVSSVINTLQTKNFWRVRIGIRPPKLKTKAENLVLKKISLSHWKIFEELFPKIKLNLEILFKTKI
jgi:PTH1 family peptidyl-tRNA hydrolase